MIDQARFRAVRKRWTEERKISSSDVLWLLQIAELQATKESADALRTPAQRAVDNILGRAFCDDCAGGVLLWSAVG